MRFGIQFFPDVGPEERSGADYFREALELAELADDLGYDHVRTVEHYFTAYGGYSPNPMLFLAAVAARTERVRLVTGAVLPTFNHPLKLAGEMGMLDAISGGRLEVGFARAFLPHEFERFGVSLDESRERFDEGMDAVGRLLEGTDVAFDGRFHSFPATTSLPRPTQQPRPPFWVAALATEESFVRAGTAGHGVMAIPLAGGKMPALLSAYRQAWKDAGHPGTGTIMLAFHLTVREDHDEVVRVARPPLNRYLHSLVEAAGDWTTGASSAAYKGYDKIIERLAQDSYENQIAIGAAWMGTPDEVTEQITSFNDEVGGFEIASMQVNFNDMPVEEARKTIELFAAEVMPRFSEGHGGGRGR